MFTVRVSNNDNRTTIVAEATETANEIFERANINSSTGMPKINGTTISRSDLDMNIEDLCAEYEINGENLSLTCYAKNDNGVR